MTLSKVSMGFFRQQENASGRNEDENRKTLLKETITGFGFIKFEKEPFKPSPHFVRHLFSNPSGRTATNLASYIFYFIFLYLLSYYLSKRLLMFITERLETKAA